MLCSILGTPGDLMTGALPSANPAVFPPADIASKALEVDWVSVSPPKIALPSGPAMSSVTLHIWGEYPSPVLGTALKCSRVIANRAMA